MGPVQSDLVEWLDPPVDMTQELEEEQPQAAHQAVAMDTDTPEAAPIEPPQGGELVQATQSPTTECDLGQEDMEVADEYQVSLHATDKEAYGLFGSQAGDQSPITLQDERTLLPSEESSKTSPGVTTGMAALDVRAEDDSSTTVSLVSDLLRDTTRRLRPVYLDSGESNRETLKKW